MHYIEKKSSGNDSRPSGYYGYIGKYGPCLRLKSSNTTEKDKFSNRNSNWYGIAKGCSHPMPNFDGVNNRDRMIIAAKISGSKI